MVSKVVDILVRTRPIGWSKRSRSPYYNKGFALWLKPTVDKMIEDRTAKVFRKETFPSISEHTLYLRVHQALLYLVEQLDTPEKIYEHFKSEIAIRKKQGVVIEFKDRVNAEGASEDFVAEVEVPKWKRKMDDWIESDSPEPFVLTNLLLSEREQEQVRAELEGLTNIMSSVTTREIKLVRVS